MDAESKSRIVLAIERYKKALRNLGLAQLKKVMEFTGESKHGTKSKLVQRGDTLLYLGFPGLGKKILELESGGVKGKKGVLPKPQVFKRKMPRAGSHPNSNLFPGSGSESGLLFNLSSQSQANGDGALSVGVPVSPSGSNCNSAAAPAPTSSDSPLVEETPKTKRISIRPNLNPNSGTMTPTSVPTQSLTVTPPPVVSGSEDVDVKIFKFRQNLGQGPAKRLPPVEGWNMRPLAFHDVVKVLLTPIELQIGEDEVHSKLKLEFELPEPEPEESSNSNGAHLTKREVLVRFCVHDGISIRLEPEDLFPPNLYLEVNQFPIDLNQTMMEHDRKKYSRPLNVTTFLNPARKNISVEVRWTKPSNYDSYSLPRYFMSAYLCKSLTVEELCTRVTQQPPLPKSHALPKIQKILKAGDSEVETASTTVKVSLLCPFSKQRIRTPCIGVDCTHLTSFDLHTFLHMSFLAKHTILRCPICSRHLKIEEVRVDQFYKTILSMHPPDVKEVQVDFNGKAVYENEAETQLKTVKIYDAMMIPEEDLF